METAENQTDVWGVKDALKHLNKCAPIEVTKHHHKVDLQEASVAPPGNQPNEVDGKLHLSPLVHPALAILEQDVHDHRDRDLAVEKRLDEGPLGEGPHWRCRVFGLRPV